MRGFPYGYAPPSTQKNEVGQNSGANMTDPIAVPDLDDPKEQKKIRKMTEKSDARIERLEKPGQDQQGQMAEMMEILRTLVRDKA